MSTGMTHLQLRKVTKRYGATVAVNEVDWVLERGTVHALVGENGAGKSTLAKIISGLTTADSGELQVVGRPVSFRSPRHAIDHGITMVAQELALVPSVDAVGNVLLGIEDHLGPLVRRGSLRRRFDDIVERTGIAVTPDVPVGSLSVAEQQKVEILRALARDADLLLLDEPTARLSGADATTLMTLIRRIGESGKTVVLVSHRLDEVLSNADAVTIMRDGRIVRTSPCVDENRDSLIEAMIGRSLAANFPAKHQVKTADTVLRVESLTKHGVFEDVSFTVSSGEIVVLAGLVGSGRSDVARAIFGAEAADSGRVIVSGQTLRRRSVGQRLRHGIAMIPESRKDQGLALQRSVKENTTLAALRRFTTAGWVRQRVERDAAARQARRVGVRAASLEMPVAHLSGGNQQKVLFARSLLDSPRMLIADEPTRGVDVGSKHAIYELLVALSGQGMALLVISSELEEVVGLAHRVLVMRAGRIVDELRGDDIKEDSIMQVAFGKGSSAA